MQKVYFLLLLLCLSGSLLAQKKEPVNPAKDKKEINGFVVRLKLKPGNYQYEILRGNRPVDLKEHNPELIMPQGFENKEDAFKLAAWVIREQKKTGHFPSMIPPHVAMELGIDTHPKPTKHN